MFDIKAIYMSIYVIHLHIGKHILYLLSFWSDLLHLENNVNPKLDHDDKNNFNKKKRLVLRCIHHFKSDLIDDNMDHMRISGTEPSSVILSQKGVISKVGK